MATELAEAYVHVIPSARGMKEKLSKEVGSEASTAGDSAGESLGTSLGSKFKKVIAAVGIGEVLKKTILEGADLEQNLGGVETLFKTSADTVKKYADEAYKTAGLSSNEYMQTVTGFSASLLQSLGGDTAKSAETANMAIIDMSDNANKMGSNMQDIQNAYGGFAKQNYTMLDNLKLGYGGTKTEMERLLADAQKITGVQYDISNLSDVYSAIHVIQGELDITGTTAKEASTTISGSMSSMKSAFSNVLGKLTLGQDIKPSLLELQESVFTFAQNLIPAIGNIISGVPALLSQLSTMIVQAIDVTSEHAPEIVQQGIQIVTEFANSIITALPYLAEAAFNLIASFAQAIINTDWIATGQQFISGLNQALDLAGQEIFGGDASFLDALLNSIANELPVFMEQGAQIIGSVLNGILQHIPDMILTAGDLLNTFINTLLQALPSLLETGSQMLFTIAQALMNNLPEIVSSAIQVVDQLIGTLMDNLPQILQTGAQILLEIVSGIINNLPEIVSSAMQIITKLITSIGTHLPEIVATGFQLLTQLAVGLINAIPNLIAQLPAIFRAIINSFLEVDWGSIGMNIIRGIASGVASFAGELVHAAVNAVSNAVDTVKGWLGIRSPARRLKDEVGKNMALGVGAGWEEYMPTEQMTQTMKVAVEDSAYDTSKTVQTALRQNRIIGIKGTESGVTDKVVNTGGININVYATANQDAKAIAEIVAEILNNQIDREKRAFA